MFGTVWLKFSFAAGSVKPPDMAPLLLVLPWLAQSVCDSACSAEEVELVEEQCLDRRCVFRAVTALLFVLVYVCVWVWVVGFLFVVQLLGKFEPAFSDQLAQPAWLYYQRA